MENSDTDYKRYNYAKSIRRESLEQYMREKRKEYFGFDYKPNQEPQQIESQKVKCNEYMNQAEKSLFRSEEVAVALEFISGCQTSIYANNEKTVNFLRAALQNLSQSPDKKSPSFQKAVGKVFQILLQLISEHITIE